MQIADLVLAASVLILVAAIFLPIPRRSSVTHTRERRGLEMMATKGRLTYVRQTRSFHDID